MMALKKTLGVQHSHQTPLASIATIAMQHGMNASVLHRWLKKHEQDARHQLADSSSPVESPVTSTVPAFIPIKLAAPAAAYEPPASQINIVAQRCLQLGRGGEPGLLHHFTDLAIKTLHPTIGLGGGLWWS